MGKMWEAQKQERYGRYDLMCINLKGINEQTNSSQQVTSSLSNS
jgi:hypothetical protein